MNSMSSINASLDSIAIALPHESVSTKTATTAVVGTTNTCRYSSKPCSDPRAIKKTGELHSFCEFHRLMANRNQRRCEQKRRTLRQLKKAKQRKIQPQPVHVLMGMNVLPALETKYKGRRSLTSPTSVMIPMASVNLYETNSSPQPTRKSEPVAVSATAPTATNSTSMLEPFPHPVQLQDEDLQYLFMTVVDSSYSFTV